MPLRPGGHNIITQFAVADNPDNGFIVCFVMRAIVNLRPLV
jgi:hypothetical protein